MISSIICVRYKICSLNCVFFANLVYDNSMFSFIFVIPSSFSGTEVATLPLVDLEVELGVHCTR